MMQFCVQFWCKLETDLDCFEEQISYHSNEDDF